MLTKVGTVLGLVVAVPCAVRQVGASPGAYKHRREPFGAPGRGRRQSPLVTIAEPVCPTAQRCQHFMCLGFPGSGCEALVSNAGVDAGDLVLGLTGDA